MKKNGKNIITSEDVTVLGKNSGKTLEEVLETLLEDSLSLKSNIKWIYKYGGVGGNGGGGGSSSITNNWSVVCKLGDKLIPEETPGDVKSLLFLGSGTYKLYLHINNPGGDSYSVLYSVNNGKSKGTAVLNVDNRWTKEINVNLLENGEVTISVINGNAVEKSFKARHIINAYSIETYLTDSTGSKYGTQDGKYNLFIDDIKERGLRLSVKYNSSIDIPVTYIYLKFKSEEEIQEEVDFKDGDYLKTLLDVEAFDDLDSLTDSDASLYIFKIKFIIDGSEIVRDISADFLPNNLYLKIIPEDSETILYPAEVTNPQTLITGNRSFIITPYNGKGGSAGNIRCTYYINDVQVVDSTTSGITEDISQPGKAFRRTLLFQLPGKNKIEFRANLGDFSASFIYYFYTKEATETIDWFDSNYNSSAYYRYSLGNNKMYRNGNLIDSSTYIIKNANDNISLDIITSSETTFSQEMLINIGILYNYINNENDEIIEIPTISAGDTNSIHIYLNKFLIGNSLLLGVFYLEEEEKYNSSDNKKYHLITIARKFIRSTGISENKYETSVYIDGILLANTGVHLAPSVYNSFILKKGNYSINLLDITYFNNNSLKETDVVRYWYAYLTRVQNDNTNFERKSNLLNIFKGFNLEKINNLYSSHVKVAYSTLTNLIHNITIPVMCIEYNPEVNKDVTGNPVKFFDWSDYNYAPDSNTAQTLTVGLKWSDGSGTFSTELEDIDVSAISTLDGQSKSGKFTLDILGSTTRSYKSKNYTLGLEFTDSDNSFIPVFTPWFNLNDTNSFLPENSFTLKADVVDSSHTNNTCMGKFINANTNKFDDAKQRNSIYSNHIKNCLEGFPYLMFVHSSGENDYYFLGIYNFNLGRTSNFNLGYSNLKALPNLRSSENYNFNVYSVPRTTTSLWEGAEILNGLITAEVDGNESWFDFSQYDKSILFPVLTIPNDSGYMFSEIVSGKDTTGLSENTKNIIAKFVERTSRGGGFVFDRIEKGFHDDLQKNYTSQKGYVPNARKLYSRSKPYDEYIYTLIKEILPKSDEDFKEVDFLNYIFTHSENDVANVAPYSNYRSIIEYYTICMAFGLLDSVLKNLNIKSWNSGNTFYLAFYDMDTCLGINNDGENVSYYAFSDYWESPESEIIDYDINDTPIVSTPSISVTRDFAPKSSDSSLYDIPSSYIFAIAKYAKSIIECYKITSEESLIDPASMATPLNLWAEWRSANGSLKDASSFIDNYYNGYMKGVDELMFNYNFKAKYFKEKSDSSYDEEFTRFRGRSIGYVKDWLTKRFHILDAYFNLEANKGIFITDGANYNLALSEDSGYEIVYELYPVNILNYSDDVNINKSIFGQNQSISGDIDIIVQAPDYTPVIATVGRNMYRYLLEDSSKKYNIKIRNTGTNKVIFGGSSMWTYIDSINSLANGTVTLISDKLLILNGNSGSVNGWDLNMPALQELHLNGANYAGDLTFDKNSLVYNLTNVDISSSKINLTVNSLNVRTINLSNVHSGSINISQCNLLENIIFSNTSIQNCTIEINYLSNESTFTLSNNNILNLNLSTANNLNLVIENDRTLKSLTVEGFKTITIRNCPLLETIESSKDVLTSIITNNCPLVKTIRLNINNCKTINISNSVLEELTLRTTNEDYSSIETLLIPLSKIRKILYLKIIEGVPNEDSRYSEQDNTINLIPLINLNNFDISGNNLILYIKFPNDFNKPIPIRNTFKGCSELLRIYGCINIINSNQTFYNLQKFSVHGDSNTWKGYSKVKEKIINGTTYNVVQTPLLLLSGELETDTHDDIITKYNNISKSDLFDDSETATNIFFDVNVSGSFTYFMLSTNISQFDVYYLLNSFGLSNINHNITIGDGAFHSILSMFNYSDGNQFNRYTFYKCSRITNFSASSTIFNTETTLWYSPTIENGQIKYDNGLFSPLINLSRITRFSGNTYIDRYIFRRQNENEKYALNSITYQGISIICDDINLYEILSLVPTFYTGKTITSGFENKIGNMTDIFKQTKISSLYSTFNMLIINYDTLTFPTTISSIGASFLNTYGFGKFKWDKIFDSNSKYNNLTAIYNTFILSDYLGNNYVEFEIFDDMFKNMLNLVYLGANYDRSAGGFYDNDASTTSPSFSYGLRGGGFSKIFRDDAVPNNITSYIPKIKNFIGLFSELYTKTNVPDISMDFPGNLFLNTLNLENISALFADCRIGINLTSEGFKNCKKLKGISRLFYMTVSSNVDNNIPRTILNVSIPYKFFYLGDSTSTKQYCGTNDPDVMNADIEYMENPESETAIQFDPTQEGNTITVPLKNPIKNILFATECFYGQDKIKGYEWNEDENFDITEYPNNNYIPFKYYKEGEVWKERSEDPKYTKLYDISSIYDGNPLHLKEEAYCLDSEQVDGFDESTLKKSSIVNYFCPPDLFNSFTNNTSLSVNGMFKWCGVGANNVYSPRMRGENLLDIMYGRICPYLFNTVNNVKYLTEFFENCKGLNSYKINNLVYLIPPKLFENTIKLSGLAKTFSGIYFDSNPNFEFLSRLVKETLDIRGIFSMCLYAQGWSISNAFLYNTLGRVSGAFSARVISFANNNYGVTANTSVNNVNEEIPPCTFLNNITSSQNAQKLIIKNNTGFVYFRVGNDKVLDSVIDLNNNYNLHI